MKRKKLVSFAEENFLQTDFNILLRLSNGDKYLRELIQETGYLRSTVNTIVERLLNTNQIIRYKNEAGIYLYSSVTKLEVNTEQYAILDYLMKDYKRFMTPNACRIICVLLDEDKYVVQDLVERGWKPSALYKNTNKLKENAIIINEDDYFKLSPEIKKKAIEIYEEDNISISTFNFDDYLKSDVEKEERINSLQKLMESKDIIAIQEFKVGKDGEWIKLLSENNYKIILPNKYKEDNYNYTIAMFLINKEIYKNYEQMTLAKDRFFPLRYTYGKLSLKNQMKIRILNLYMPQSYNASEERKEKIKEFWEKVIQEARKCRKINEYFILLGNLNTFNGGQSENRDNFKRLDDIMIDVFEDKIKDKPDWGYTWVSENGKTKKRLDYIFINSKVVYDYNIKCNVDDSPLKNKISDHKILEIELKELL